MMGDVCQIDVKLNEDCGITPRIFEYLFSRIREEEEKRRDERLKFSCRCSFLEIYNEQITDLLEPSSTSLQLREDLKKGVYVENLSEHSVQNVNDVLKLLSQGTANRKMAATYMNSESSRSHSVFTCIVESHWEKDSVTHLRFARLNLVDLAGSERQKSSGAEGDRLKEAASINKSLSTLGLVIMSLVDLAHGKHRHVPYRDSRLTFLLQDSLGGNSKTTVIANVSPSICSAYETLSTLKFAQRAKLIQNNAKINEDASGNVTALQKQIQQLKGQLSLLLEQHHMPSPPQPNLRYSVDSKLPGEVNHHGDMEKLNDNDRKMKSLEAILVGTIRREKLAERTNRRLEAELEHANLLAQQREEEIQKVQRMLKLSRDRISQLELLDHGSVEMHLIEENNVSKEKTQPPQELHDTNSELTRLQVENSSLFKQLSLFQEFYEQGERKKLLAEISELRDQLLETLERKHDGPKHSLWNGAQDIDNAKELKECKHMNSKLIREVDELGTQLEEYICGSKSVTGIERETTLVILANDPSLVESSSKAYEKGEENEFQNKVSNGDLENTSMIVDSLVIQPCNTKKVLEDSQALSEAKKLQEVEALHSKLDQVRRDLENAQLLNHNYHQQQVSKVSEERQTELVREQVEMETAKTILQLQEDIVSLQSELEGKLCNMSKENSRLKKVVAAKDDEIKRLCHDWELATLELTSFLSDGSRSLNDASNEIQSIASSFPCVNGWLNDHVESAAKVVLQKEEIIILLQKSLEDAQEKALEMEQKLDFLKGAAIVFSEVQKEETDLTVSDAIKLAIQPNSKFNSNECLEDKHVLKKDHVTEAGVMPMSNLAITLGSNSQQICHMKDTELATLILESANAISASIKDIDEFASAIQSSIIEVSSFYREFSGTLMQDIFQMREEFKTMKETVVTSGIQFVGDRKYLERTINHDFEKKLEDNCRELTSINSSVKRILHICENPVGISHLEELDVQKDVSASSNSAYLEESLCSIECSNGVSRASFIERTGRTTKQDLDKEYDGHLRSSSNYKESEVSGHSRSSFNNKAVLLCLKEEIEKANDAANYLNILLAPFIKTVDKELESARFYTQELLAQSRFCDMREIVRGEKFNPACCITKLEEVYAAMREADNMLKSLLKANKNANSLADMWKMECNELKVEKESLTNEIEKLQSSISVKDGENKLLQNHINCSQQEINYAVSSLEGTFQQMQTEVVEMLNADHARARETVEGTLHHICMFRSFLEDICVATTENGFLFVLMSDYHKRQSFNSNSKFSSGPCGSMSSLQRDLLGDKNENFLWMDESHSIISRQNEEGDQRLNEGTLVLSDNNLLHENHVLKKELERKDDVLKGLFFDFSLLQEATATTKDYKDERERLLFVLRKVQKELMTKTDQVNGMLDEHIKLKSSLAKYVKGLDQAEGRLYLLSEENENLSVLVKNLQTKNSEFQKQLVEQSDVVNNLENEILRLTCCADEKSLQSMMGDLRRITIEREDLQNLVASLQEKLDLACSFADENEAIATEARLESETSKVYAEQKEEEVKILERSVEELESTINILENKVLEMEEDIENQRLLRDSLEYELEELKERMITVESFTDNIDSENSFQCLSEDQITRKHNKFVEHQEMCKQIRILEEENVELIKEIKQYKEYISEVILHTEAQASQYQEKYTTLEAMLHEVKTNASSATYMALTSDKPEKSSRPRGSSSPFRCITNLVQQTNMEMDRELSDARLRIQELEELLKSSQKEVCVLSTRLAASESMTHDVIRDLLGVKMDITNYANMIDQHQIQRLVEESQQQAQEFIAMKEEITNLKEQVDGLLDQRERYISEAKRRQAEIIASHVKIEQLEEHDRLHTLQNEVLRVENGKLQRRISEMDERLRKLFATQNANALPRIQKQFRLKENGMPAPKQQDDDAEMSKRVEKSRKLLSQVNTELSSYHRYEKLDDGRAAAIGKGILEESNNNDKRW